jgi:hypothetical protein
MGCSSSRPSTIDDPRIILKLKKDREAYNNRHEYFEQVYCSILLDIKKELDPSNKETIEIIIKKLKSGNYNGITNLPSSTILSDEELRECLVEYTAQIYIEENSLIKDYDGYDMSFKTAEEANIFSTGNKTKDYAKLLVDNFSRLFPKIQKGVFLNLNDQDIDVNLLNAILINFKFNLSFSVQALSLVSNNFLLKNPEICHSVSEVIDCDKNLISFLLHVFDDEDKHITQNMLGNLSPIFHSLTRNENIKFLLIQTVKSGVLTLTQEMESCIISLLQSDSLLGLYLGKFNFSDNFISELGKCIASSKNLKFLLIESKISNLNLLDDLVIHGIGRNRSIHIAIVAGFDISESKSREYKQVQKHNEVLKFFEVVKEIL